MCLSLCCFCLGLSLLLSQKFLWAWYQWEAFLRSSFIFHFSLLCFVIFASFFLLFHLFLFQIHLQLLLLLYLFLSFFIFLKFVNPLFKEHIYHSRCFGWLSEQVSLVADESKHCIEKFLYATKLLDSREEHVIKSCVSCHAFGMF